MWGNRASNFPPLTYKSETALLWKSRPQLSTHEWFTMHKCHISLGVLSLSRVALVCLGICGNLWVSEAEIFCFRKHRCRCEAQYWVCACSRQYWVTAFVHSLLSPLSLSPSFCAFLSLCLLSSYPVMTGGNMTRGWLTSVCLCPHMSPFRSVPTAERNNKGSKCHVGPGHWG